jgi:hypothetical protein
MTDYNISNNSVTSLDNALKDEKTRLENKDKLITNAETTQNRIQTLNESYRKRYVYYNYIAVVVVIAFLAYFVIVILQYYFPIIPSLIVDLSSIGLFAFVIIFVGYNLLIIYSRDRIDFDKMNMDNTNVISKAELDKMRKKSLESGNLSEAANVDIGKNCIGAACCPRYKYYDTVDKRCLDPDPTPIQLSAPENAGRYIKVETFANISEPFSEINNGKVKPFEPSEFDNYAKI